MAVVYGRRRQGKTVLLQALAEQTHALYWQAIEGSATANLRRFELAVAAHRSTAAPAYASWEDAFRDVLDSPEPSVVLIDEFGYLCDHAPEIPSVLQAVWTPALQRRSAVHLVLCGSTYAQMERLIARDAPLRGRASSVITVAPFGFRESADFWGLADHPEAAFKVHALVGGTPAYRDFVHGRPSRGNVDQWMTDHVLRPDCPLASEGELLIAADGRTDRSLYWSVLSAIIDGFRRPSEIAQALGRSVAAVQFPLGVLASSRLIELVVDPLDPRRTTAVLTEPILRLHAVVLAGRSHLLGSRAKAMWEDAQSRVASRVYAPHLEHIAIEWVRDHAAPVSVGGLCDLVGPSMIGRGSGAMQLDLVGTAAVGSSRRAPVIIGEVKSGSEPVGAGELARLDVAAGLLSAKAGNDAPIVRLLVARAGFTADLRRAARIRSDVQLVDLDRLYGGA